MFQECSHLFGFDSSVGSVLLVLGQRDNRCPFFGLRSILFDCCRTCYGCHVGAGSLHFCMPEGAQSFFPPLLAGPSGFEGQAEVRNIPADISFDTYSIPVSTLSP